MLELGVRRAGAAEIVDIVGDEPNVWSVVIAAPRGIDALAASLRDEYEFASAEVGEGSAALVHAPNARDLLTALERTASADVCLIKGLEHWSEAEIRVLDLSRTALSDHARGVIVTTLPGAQRLRSLAPNLWSWIGSRCFEIDPTAGVMDRDARLASLRTFFAMSDEDLVRRVSAGEVPVDPALAEWLILLGRDDLLGQ